MTAFIILSIILVNFIIAILLLHNEKNNRLIWHLLICFFPVIGPLMYFLYKSNLLNNRKLRGS